MTTSKIGKGLAGLAALILLAYLLVWAGVALVPGLEIPFFTPVRGTFGLCALLALYTGVGLLVLRNPVHAALSLVGNFFFLAVIYLLLQSVLLAVLQILVYAGAIMVLFLFVVMFFYQPRQEVVGSTPIQGQGAIGAVLGVAFLALIVLSVFQGAGGPGGPEGSTTFAIESEGINYLFGGAELPDRDRMSLPVGPGETYALQQSEIEQGKQRGPDVLPDQIPSTFGGQIRAVGIPLYTDYLIPFELTSVLILVAIVGAVVMGRDRTRHLEEGPTEREPARRAVEGEAGREEDGEATDDETDSGEEEDAE